MDLTKNNISLYMFRQWWNDGCFTKQHYARYEKFHNDQVLLIWNDIDKPNVDIAIVFEHSDSTEFYQISNTVPIMFIHDDKYYCGTFDFDSTHYIYEQTGESLYVIDVIGEIVI